MTKRRGLRRWFVRAVVFLLLGAAVNVAVAWGCVCCWSPEMLETNYENSASAWHAPVPKYWTTSATHIRGHRFGVDRFISSNRVLESGPRQREIVMRQYVIQSGLPTRSLYLVRNTSEYAHLRHMSSLWWPSRNWTEGLSIPKSLPQFSTGWGWELPTRPLWIGFAINTVFYAVIIWLLFTAPFALRRWRRVRRGLCSKCAYPVGASDVCTECGRAVREWRGSRIPEITSGRIAFSSSREW